MADIKIKEGSAGIEFTDDAGKVWRYTFSKAAFGRRSQLWARRSWENPGKKWVDGRKVRVTRSQ